MEKDLVRLVLDEDGKLNIWSDVQALQEIDPACLLAALNWVVVPVKEALERKEKGEEAWSISNLPIRLGKSG